MPFGTEDLDPVPHVVSASPRIVRCYVRGRRQELHTPTRHSHGDVCPDHGIRCHFSANSATYSYVDVRRNFVVDPELVAKRIIGHPFKHEAHRLGQEKSEDAVSFNVFRSLQRSGLLHAVANRITGLDIAAEPQLYLWGLACSDDSLEPWDLLIAARERFEKRRPVERPMTEPDIAPHLPGRYLILIEAKFTSPNGVYENSRRRTSACLTKEELLEIYWDRRPEIPDPVRAKEQSRIYYQLWRNLIFAEVRSYATVWKSGT